jgi:hypothetical protein
MPLRSIIVVFLRLFALQWAVQSLGWQVPMLIQLHHWTTPVFLIYNSVIALACWMLAEPISRLATRNHDVSVPLGGLTRQDLYAFAFVYLGLSFSIGGIGSVVMTLATLFANTVNHPTANEALQLEHLPQIGKSFIQSIVGLIALFNANRFAKKLVSREE